MPHSDWKPDLYLRFDTYRTRAARDLLARVDLDEAPFIADLGCGPGNSTALLAERWPTVKITGIDNSAEMINRARERYPGITWIEADLASWHPASCQDLIFANAAFQWVPNHADLLLTLCSYLRPGGILAFQVPSIHQQPAAEVYRHLIDSARWRDFSLPAEKLTVETPSFYHDVLGRCCRAVEIWETVYHHFLASHEQMVVWYQSTGLRPFLARLPDDCTRAAFADELAAHYREQFPALANGGVLFPFRRLFVLATN